MVVARQTGNAAGDVVMAPAAPVEAPASAPAAVAEAGPQAPDNARARRFRAPRRCRPGRIPTAWSATLAQLLGRSSVMTFHGRRGLHAALRGHHRQPGAAEARCRGCGQLRPTPGKLQRIVAGDAELIAPDNARRYAPLRPSSPRWSLRARRRCTGASTRCSSRPMPSWLPRATSTTASSGDRPPDGRARNPAQPPAVHRSEVKGEVPSTRPGCATSTPTKLGSALGRAEDHGARRPRQRAPPQGAGWPDSAAPSRPPARQR